MSTLNPTRAIALEALKATLEDLVGRTGVSEKMFHAEWQRRLAENANVFADGWYSPPPHGMSILFGDRTNCRSLRDRVYWPSGRVIDWRNDLFFAYASPVGKLTGMPGDVSLTLYFGSSPKIRAHFKATYKVNAEVLSSIEAADYESSFDLVFAANAAFARAGYRNMVFSTTDPAMLNLGHTFPVIDVSPAQRAMTAAQKEDIRMSRLYLNAVTKWPFSEGLQFTFEPQLVSLHDEAMPKVRYHHVVIAGKKLEVIRDLDHVLKHYDLV